MDTSAGTDKVIGHVVANDAGAADVELDSVIDTLFPSFSTATLAASATQPPFTSPPRAMRGESVLRRALDGIGVAIRGGRSKERNSGGNDNNRRRVVGLVSIVVDRDVRQQVHEGVGGQG